MSSNFKAKNLDFFYKNGAGTKSSETAQKAVGSEKGHQICGHPKAGIQCGQRDWPGRIWAYLRRSSGFFELIDLGQMSFLKSIKTVLNFEHLISEISMKSGP